MIKLFQETLELLITLSVVRVFAIYFTVLHLVGIPEEKMALKHFCAVSRTLTDTLMYILKFKYGTNQKTYLQTTSKFTVHINVWRAKGEIGFESLPYVKVNFCRAWGLAAKKLEK